MFWYHLFQRKYDRFQIIQLYFAALVLVLLADLPSAKQPGQSGRHIHRYWYR
jgi:hypothetical protein